jgi:hypothetical protein
VLNNLDWFGGMGLLTFLREIGEWLAATRAGTVHLISPRVCPPLAAWL